LGIWPYFYEDEQLRTKQRYLEDSFGMNSIEIQIKFIGVCNRRPPVVQTNPRSGIQEQIELNAGLVGHNQMKLRRTNNGTGWRKNLLEIRAGK
jgi:hypothetical protein